jgi:serine/threonine protein kinase
MAPEISNGLTGTTKVDMWALGIILHQLLTKKLPFESKNHLEFMRLIRENEPAALPEKVSPFIKNIISKLLEKNPDKRISADELVKIPEIEKYIQQVIEKVSKVDNDAGLLIRKEFVKLIKFESKCNLTFEDKVYL